MKHRLSSLLLMLFSAGMLAIGAVSCATPAVKKPDIKPTPNHGSQTTSTTNTTSTSTTTKTKVKTSAVQVQQMPVANQINDSIAIIDSVRIERKAP